MSMSWAGAKSERSVRARPLPSVSPPISTWRSDPAAASARPSESRRPAGTSRIRLRIIVGTTATRVARCSARSRRKAAAVNFSRGRSTPPCSSVSSATQMPKLKVMFSTSRVRSPSAKPSRLWIAASLPAKARWESTAPFGRPDEPEVKTISAAPCSMGRDGGASCPCCLSERSHSKRARVLANTWAAAPCGVLRWTGTTTPPASHTPRYATKSSGWLETRTWTGSSARSPAAASALRTWCAVSRSSEKRISSIAWRAENRLAASASSVPRFSIPIRWSRAAWTRCRR